MSFGPTPRGEWVTAGDRCRSHGGWEGTVLMILHRTSPPIAHVQWDVTGAESRSPVTYLLKLPAERRWDA